MPAGRVKLPASENDITAFMFKGNIMSSLNISEKKHSFFLEYISIFNRKERAWFRNRRFNW
jgi:hypothetical protein